jgi:hypothetical protein
LEDRSDESKIQNLKSKKRARAKCFGFLFKAKFKGGLTQGRRERRGNIPVYGRYLLKDEKVLLEPKVESHCRVYVIEKLYE